MLSLLASGGGNSRLLWLFVHCALAIGGGGEARLASCRLPTRTLASGQSWLPCALEFDQRLNCQFYACGSFAILGRYVQSIVWTEGTPGEFCLLSRIGWTLDKVRGGVEAAGRVTPIQAFFGGKDRQLTSSGRTELKSVRWTDSLSYFQTAVLALPWIERFLPRGRTILKEGNISQTYFLLPIVIFGIKWAPSGATPLCLGPILGGRKVNVGQPGTSFYLSMLQLCAKNGLDETFINAEKI